MLDDYRIYPKQYKFEKTKIQKGKCFFIMPFDEAYDIVYGTLRKNLSEAGFCCSRVDEVPKSTPIIGKVITEILNSQFVIADLSDCNPNVFYELGIAHSFKDAQNILLIKRKGSKVPFDIMHLTYFEYEEDNLKYISSIIKQNLKSAEYLYDFHEILQNHGILRFLSSNQEEFIEDLKDLLAEDIVVVTHIYNFKITLEDDELDNLFLRLENKTKEYIIKSSDDKISSILNFLYELLLSSSNRECTKKHLVYLLEDYFLGTNLSNQQILSLKTDLVLRFASANVQLPIVMPWIVQYFSRSKTANIDLNRYKLESFLLTTENNEINQMLIDAVRHSDCHVREHIADIIGEKQLINARSILALQLKKEKNYYSAVSIIRALGRLNDATTINVITKWFEANEDEIMRTKQHFVLKHIYLALQSLNGDIAKQFYSKYSQYLKEFFI